MNISSNYFDTRNLRNDVKAEPVIHLSHVRARFDWRRQLRNATTLRKRQGPTSDFAEFNNKDRITTTPSAIMDAKLPSLRTCSQPVAARVPTNAPQLRKPRPPPQRKTHRDPRCAPNHPSTNNIADTEIAVLCVQGAEVEAGRVHALFQRQGPGTRLRQLRRPVQVLHGHLRIQGLRNRRRVGDVQ